MGPAVSRAEAASFARGWYLLKVRHAGNLLTRFPLEIGDRPIHYR